MAVCQECKAIFSPLESKQRDLCPECVKLENEDFELVKDYIQKHPYSNILEIVHETEVPLKSVEKMIRGGRLHLRM